MGMKRHQGDIIKENGRKWKGKKNKTRKGRWTRHKEGVEGASSRGWWVMGKLMLYGT